MNPRCWRIKPGSKTGRRTIKIQSEVGLSQCFALGKVFEKLHQKSKVQPCNSMNETPPEKEKLAWYNLETDCKNLKGRNTARKRTPHMKGRKRCQGRQGRRQRGCRRRAVWPTTSFLCGPGNDRKPQAQVTRKGGRWERGEGLNNNRWINGGERRTLTSKQSEISRQMEVLSGHGELSFYVMIWSFW